ncbi:MAG: cytochrome c3 family protein [Nitrospirota bacterium]
MKKRLLCILAALAVVCLSAPGWAMQGLSEEDRVCMGCHDQERFMLFESGEKVSVKVQPGDIKRSVHAILGCTQCHDFAAGDHPRRVFKTREQYHILAARTCTKCHTSHKTEIHAKLIKKSPKGTVCTDCHGAHNVRRAREMTQGNRLCLNCHAVEAHMTFKDGTRQSIQIDEKILNQSIHKDLSCSDCHFGFSSEEHPVRAFRSKRDMSIALSESCRRCHFDKYSKTLESIHFNLLAQGNLSAPVCTDCHGAHSVLSGRREKLANARKCQQCHGAIYGQYVQSVHGGALISEHNEDVPICSDCHKAHDISDPRTADFRNTVPQLCGKCHENKEIMKKYGLSTSVVDSYLQDFHGVTLKFYRKKASARSIAVCTDCHGIHDITSTRGADAATIKANLARRCQKCHQDATHNFPDSWISHYEPDLKKAPLVYLINAGYKIFIPFMIIGLLLQILLHIWRYAVNK